MSEQHQCQIPKRVATPADYMANERTFLAWVRTSIAIMAFGFVVEKFSLFIKQISLLLKQPSLSTLTSSSTLFKSYSSIFGIVLVGLGALICLLAFIKYKNIQKQLELASYQSSILLDIMLTLIILAIGVFLVIYLIHSI